MTNKMINSANAPAAVGPYSHSVFAGQTQYISGQLGLDPVSGEMKETVEQQAEQALTNLGAILKEAGMTYDHVVKTTVFLKNMSDFAKINDIYGKYFSNTLPARSCVEVCELPKNGLFEVEAIAVKN
ncbi:RidA family protein [Enterococcus sp. DIV0242_7C1]|uniref:Endoribonuclease L-PSP n=1 Tax=Candidatus Enterococcus dunnyi TaxID=1834192 RepID=A0A200JD61_9ENTE|nr:MULTISPECIES: RidA family protein [unclassified Enterococcus]MBO0469578.1 RidA family protein [Enterococcus sp. DIV0242_7C1]MCA5011893.1 RidA family protein [Enterococcus sp. S23]MCA5014665.1 RidA family protein [Enterococcus sp. S22(2020)]OUZ35134.1 endoribonuclease L-PSP [Enterococcus sp. 9D6_DIV0238]